MIVFWVAAGLLAAGAAGLILQRAAVAARVGSADPTLPVYRRQIAELDELADRGLIVESEQRSARAEAARRLLAAADRAPEAWSEVDGRRGLLLTAALAPILTLAVYLAVGAPGAPDQPFAARLAAWRADDPAKLDAAQMAAVMTVVSRERPTDPEAFRYLALARGAAGDGTGAVIALERALGLAPKRADLWELLGQARIGLAGGAVSSDAAAAFREALRLDPTSTAARFHLARARIDAGDKAAGLADWRALLSDLPPADPRRAELQAAIDQVEGRAPAVAAAPPAPDAIRGMVEGLAARLKAQPDDAEGWTRLVRSYAVLGDAAKRDAALAEARRRFANRPEVLTALEQAAAAEPMR